MATIIESLEQLGFFRIEKSLNTLYKIAEENVERAGTNSNLPKFEALVSYIPAKSGKASEGRQLIIDIGGTSTKVGLREVKNNNTSWQVLLEKNNNFFKPNDITSKHFETYASKLAENILACLRTVNVEPTSVTACAIIWSNALQNKIWAGKGITGLVVQRDQYRKGEWFMEDLVDGVDLGQVFGKAFQQAGLNLRKFLIGNDTPLTMKALSESSSHSDSVDQCVTAHGGMVASTGLNGTIVKTLKELEPSSSSDELVICNAEAGGRFMIGEELQSLGDCLYFQKNEITIEILSAGGFLPYIFKGHVKKLIELGHTEFQSLDTAIENLNREFKTEDLTALLDNPNDWVGQLNITNYNPTLLESATYLVRAIFIRSAKLCAIVAYSTVCNQLTNNQEKVVALDSRLAQEVPIFWKAFQEQMNAGPNVGRGIKIVAKLVEPIRLSDGGKISVPMQGAGYALDAL